jgi:hypothetical protein
MKTPVGKIHPRWIRGIRKEFKHFLRMTEFPEPARNGERGPEFEYPEWLIMFIAILAVKAKVKTYTGIHRLSRYYWKYISADKKRDVISESVLRGRLKKISHSPGRPAEFIFQIFPAQVFEEETEEKSKKEKRKSIDSGKRR